MTWTLPGSTTTTDSTTTQFNQGSISAQPLTVHAKATDAFQDGVPKVQFHFDDGVISGDADDDSDSTQYSVTDPMTRITTWKQLVYKVSGHVPGSMVRATPSTPDNPVSQPPGKTYWTNEALVMYILKDTNGDVMPGVYVQERFTDNNRLNLTINGSAGAWYTLRSSAVDSGSVAPGDGKFSEYDHLQYTWPGATANPESTTHAYYGGTVAPTFQATTGIPLGSATITFTPGQPGTATQTDPVPPLEKP